MTNPQDDGFPPQPMTAETMLDQSLYNKPGRANPAERTELLSQEEPPAVMAWLVFVSDGPREGQMVRLLGSSMTIGRADDCEIQVDDRAISRQHAKVRMERNGDEIHYVIHDLATDNGTFVNGNRNLPVELKNGDIVRLGRSELMFKRI
ncbi:MAG: FHA domain-containing protein [Candidatus Viridilinea halotolerans]|uniref:FHA domain-containing protein n=1 Tax=Candidatus Viridilinea halotolerans TaxID=2491704 RepID=A0A426TS98_9CHLR|nr:MAG: FHA domain-containing protein [Candidatus Viridilinea halotolerans]